MSTVPVVVAPRGFGRTARRDAWWVTPGVQFLVLSSFVVYATWAAFQNRVLHVRPVSLAVLLARDLRRLASCVVRAQAVDLAGVAAVLAGASHPSVPRTLPRHVLLLSRRLLQGLLGRSAVVRGRRAAQHVSRRKLLSADSAERAPLLPVRGAAVPDRPELRRVEGAVVHRRERHGVLRRRRRHAGPC